MDILIIVLLFFNKKQVCIIHSSGKLKQMKLSLVSIFYCTKNLIKRKVYLLIEM
jgi:hypothetical protein